jgi:hypothetical protein
VGVNSSEQVVASSVVPAIILSAEGNLTQQDTLAVSAAGSGSPFLTHGIHAEPSHCGTGARARILVAQRMYAKTSHMRFGAIS